MKKRAHDCYKAAKFYGVDVDTTFYVNAKRVGKRKIPDDICVGIVEYCKKCGEMTDYHRIIENWSQQQLKEIVRKSNEESVNLDLDYKL